MRKIKRICTSDIESNNWIDFLMIGIFDGHDYNIFSSLDEYLTFCIKHYIGYRIYFHNGGKFDFLFLVDKLMKLGELTFLSSTGGLINIKLKTKKGTIEFTDSIFLLPASLEVLIDNFSIEEKKIKINFNKQHKFENKKLQHHLKNDCISLYKILRIVERENGFLSYTVASSSLRIFKRDYFDGDFWNVSDYFDVYFRKNYYRGGRVEVYKGYGKNLYYYDINSLYPFVMLQPMPCGSPKRTKKFIKNKIGFYKIELLEDYNEKISLLIKKTDKGNFFVSAKKGEIFYIISPELKILITKVKVKILDGYYFQNEFKLFNKYVSDFYEKKKNAKTKYERYISKLMLNSLYGKFGQKLKSQDLEFYKGQDNFIVYNAELDLVLVDRIRKISYKGVYIASYITSLARAYHFNLMDNIGFENIYYCDTDSIITNKKIKVGDEIGDLKLEAEIKEGVFVLPKVYGYIDKEGKEFVRVKGFRNKFKFTELLDLAENKIESLKQIRERVLGFRESLRRKKGIYKSNSDYLKTELQTKRLMNNYTRRKKILKKGIIFDSVPFNSEEIKIKK